MKELMGVAITKHAKDQMNDRRIVPDVVRMALTDFDCFRLTECDDHYYVNLWRGPVRVTVARDPECWTIVTVAWTDHISAESYLKEAV